MKANGYGPGSELAFKERQEAYLEDIRNAENPENMQLETYVLGDKGTHGIILVRKITRYDNEKNPTGLSLERFAYPGATEEEIEDLQIHKSHAGMEYARHFGNTFVSPNPRYRDAIYIIIPAEEDGKIRELLGLHPIQRTTKEGIKEGQEIYRTLLPKDPDGTFGYDILSILQEMGFNPEKHTLETDVMSGKIKLDANGDYRFGHDMRNFDNMPFDRLIFTITKNGFEDIELNLRNTGFTLGEEPYTSSRARRQKVFSDESDWLPPEQRNIRNIKVDITKSKIPTEDGKTIYDNGTFMRPQDDEIGMPTY